MDMDLFPDNHDLIDIFECEPVLLDENDDIPWFYNKLRFVLKRHDNILEFEISPSISQINLRWKNNNQLLISLTLEDVKGLLIEKKGGYELFRVIFEERVVNDLIITTKPHITLEWGTNRNI
ncbi:hypothetical protein V1503_05145 [Bacillus sp. SCS-151]|uniref:hypothetical protein n=1 Tax=Nanhaiella sioensis TaxID=3115293 RepID=UPI00397C56A9